MDILPRLYRFALLLKGSPEQATEAVEAVFNRFGPQLGQFRQSKQRSAFLVRKLREHKVSDTTGSTCAELDNDLAALLAKFAMLSEPSRSALALFYSELFPASEAADVLSMSLEDYAHALAIGRTLLAGSPPLAS